MVDTFTAVLRWLSAASRGTWDLIVIRARADIDEALIPSAHHLSKPLYAP